MEKIKKGGYIIMVSVLMMLKEGETIGNRTEINSYIEVIEDKQTVKEKQAIDYILTQIGVDKGCVVIK